MAKKRINNHFWLEEYRCGCSQEADRKSDLFGYCGKHGDNRINLYKLPRKVKGEAIPPSAKVQGILA